MIQLSVWLSLRLASAKPSRAERQTFHGQSELLDWESFALGEGATK